MNAVADKNNMSRRAFSLVEVMIATVVLGIGLVGIGAIFPAVISQQRDASDLSNAIVMANNAEALLSSRLEKFGESLAPVEKTNGWIRINAYEPPGREEAYLQMPADIPRQFYEGPRNLDFRLRVPASYSVTDTPRVVGAKRGWNNESIVLPRRPVERADTESIRVVFTIFTGGQLEQFVLIPDIDDFTGEPLERFTAEIPSWRFDEADTMFNAINYVEGRVGFHVSINPGEVIRSVKVVYKWLDDHIISHEDRLYPVNSPRYGWDMCFRKTIDGFVQTCLFVYRFDGPQQYNFLPDFPDSFGRLNQGMLRVGRGRVQPEDGKYLLVNPNLELQKALDRGVWLLPVEGNAPVKVRRIIRAEDRDSSENAWELDSPPMATDDNGDVIELINQDVQFWYMPLEIDVDPTQSQGQPVTWRITPIIARVGS